ncbi:MAG: 2TM domain-containing protein [Bacteroidia bacterium]|nr:2TM domain-containing protein [Bacteroidia bacterium]
MELENEKDKMLWKEAKRRVGFKNHLITYFVINIFFWVMWYFTDYRHADDGHHSGIPWPTFCTLGWGFGLFWHGVGVYMRGNTVDKVEKEYQKLKDKQK